MVPKHIIFLPNLDQSLQQALKQWSNSKIAILMDENTERWCYPLVQDQFPPHQKICIKSGEEFKNLETCRHIWQELTAFSFERDSLLLNLGGGVITDMGGFCASTFKRGIAFINIPTTLLAQVDASIGGKLGIDFQGFKNHIGLFQEPHQVLIHPQFLKTLSQRELRSGLAEIIKHSLIADRIYWKKLVALKLEKENWGSHVLHSVEIKSKVVDEDPKESGLRKILNFGHTLGHAIESYFLESAQESLLHGEAVASGIIMESYLSHIKLQLPLVDLEEITQLILKLFGKIGITADMGVTIAKLAQQDKKNQDGLIKCVLLKAIGQPATDIDINGEEMQKALEYYMGLDPKQ